MSRRNRKSSTTNRTLSRAETNALAVESVAPELAEPESVAPELLPSVEVTPEAAATEAVMPDIELMELERLRRERDPFDFPEFEVPPSTSPAPADPFAELDDSMALPDERDHPEYQAALIEALNQSAEVDPSPLMTAEQFKAYLDEIKPTAEADNQRAEAPAELVCSTAELEAILDAQDEVAAIVEEPSPFIEEPTPLIDPPSLQEVVEAQASTIAQLTADLDAWQRTAREQTDVLTQQREEAALQAQVRDQQQALIEEQAASLTRADALLAQQDKIANEQQALIERQAELLNAQQEALSDQGRQLTEQGALLDAVDARRLELDNQCLTLALDKADVETKLAAAEQRIQQLTSSHRKLWQVLTSDKTSPKIFVIANTMADAVDLVHNDPHVKPDEIVSVNAVRVDHLIG